MKRSPKAGGTARRLACAFAALACAPLLVAAGPRNYRVTVAPSVILPPEQLVARGTERTVRQDDILVRARLGWLNAATLDQDVTLTIAGESATLSSGTILLGALASGGDLDTLPSGFQVYCAEERYNSGRGVANMLTLGLAAAGQRVRPNSRFCLVDSDADARFDGAFLVGTRRAEDRQMHEVAPAAYRAEVNMPMRGENEIQVSYSQGRNNARPTLRTQIVQEGRRQSFYSIVTLAGPGTLLHTSPSVRLRPNRAPQKVLAASAAFTLLDFDATTGAADPDRERLRSCSLYADAAATDDLHPGLRRAMTNG